MAALRFRYVPPTAGHSAGGWNALTIKTDHPVGADHMRRWIYSLKMKYRQNNLRNIWPQLPLCVSLVLAFATSAQAAIKPDWQCKDDESLTACARNGRLKSIYIYDSIDEQTAYSLAYIDGLLPAGYKLPKIYVNSFGGDVDAAQMMGRILRRRKASIETKDVIKPQLSAECTSACVFIAAGATDRQMAHIGLHAPFGVKNVRHDTVKISKLPETSVSEILAYYDEMGINPNIKRLTSKTPSSDLLNITFNPEAPFDKQMIVKLGFRMHRVAKTKQNMPLKQISDEFDKVEELKEAANQGDARAAKRLGDIYFNGTEGFEKWIPEAIKWYQKASDLGDLHMTHYLGVIYENGIESIPVDHAKANFYYAKAAQAGLAASQNNLGFFYYKGQGIQKNNVMAAYWLTRAAEQGEAFAYGSLGEMHFDFKGSGFPKDDIETYKWLKLAVGKLPDGKSKQEDLALLKAVTKRMSKADITKADKLASEWTPLRQSPYKLANKEE